MAGKYVELDKQVNGDLRITLLPEAREDVQEIAASEQSSADAKLAEIIEWHLGEGWSFVPPEDIGALTEAPILSDDIDLDEQGKVQHVGVVYWFPGYEVKDPIAQLLEDGYVDFTQVK